MSGERTVTVTGVASAGARPDRATLSLGVQARRASAAEAMGRAAERSQSVIDALRQAGAGDADLRTTGLNLWFDQSERTYVSSTSLTVDVGVDDVGRHLDVAARAGGDDFTLNGVSFTISDPAAVLAPLRELALADARAKATALAAAEGARVGDVLAIVEGGGGAIPMPRAGMRMLASMPVEPGSDTLTLQVTATYELIASDGTPS